MPQVIIENPKAGKAAKACMANDDATSLRAGDVDMRAGLCTWAISPRELKMR